MIVPGRNTVPRERMQSERNLRQTALGLVSTSSFPAIVGTADMMLKSAGVTLVGFEKIGSGHCTAIVRGGISDVRIAVAEGAATAEKFGQLISSLVIPRPYPNLDVIFPISHRLAAEVLQGRRNNRLINQAVGLLETRGFPAMVGAADAMLKAAEVQLASYETIGSGLCTAIIRGSVADVAIAVEAGMYEAERIGELNAVMVIPRPLDDLEESLPVASCWIDKPQPLPILMPLAEKERELAELPDLKQLAAPQKELVEIIEPEIIQPEVMREED